MLKLGHVQELKIIKKVEFGVYLADPQADDPGEKVLLPIRQVPEGAGIGDRVTVFLYKDSKDRLISTTKLPLLKMGEVGVLKVAQITKMGAFLNWGLEKDLFLPFREQTGKVEEGDECLVSLYTDKSGRLCATMKVYHHLQTDSPYQKNDKVDGIVYEISKNFGAFVAVDDRYSALIPAREYNGDLKPGDRIHARVIAVKEDGKLDLSIKEKLPVQIAMDAQRVLEVIESFDGALPFNDKASPEVIRREMEKSKLPKNPYDCGRKHLASESKRRYNAFR